MKVLTRLIDGIKTACGNFYDSRTGKNTQYEMTDIGMAAFSLFYMQSPSWLAHQRLLKEEQGSSNCQSLFGMEEIPTDNHIRAMLDEVNPYDLRACFNHLVDELIQGGGLSAFRQIELGKLIPIALMWNGLSSVFSGFNFVSFWTRRCNL